MKKNTMNFKFNEKLSRTSIIILSIFPAIFIIPIAGYGIYIRTHFEEYRNKAACEMFDEFKNRTIHGFVNAKYLDENHHLNETIEVKGEKIMMTHDISGFYDFIQIGDSINKEMNKSDIRIIRNEVFVRSFEIDFGCRLKKGD
jgi:hypothetical protein